MEVLCIFKSAAVRYVVYADFKDFIAKNIPKLWLLPSEPVLNHVKVTAI